MLCFIADFNDRPNHMEDYKHIFIEKYGYDVSVSINEMLDNDLGIGAPAGYTVPQTKVRYHNKFRKQNIFKTYLDNEIDYALKHGLSEIVLTDEKIASFFDTKKESIVLPYSLETYVEL